MTASRTGAGIHESAEEVKSIEEFDGNSEEVPCVKDDLLEEEVSTATPPPSARV